MACCRGDESDAESSEDDDPKKPIPEWARGRALMQQLASQVQTDPDEVFQQHRKTCSLDEVFGHSGLPAHSRTNCCCVSVRVKCFRSLQAREIDGFTRLLLVHMKLYAAESCAHAQLMHLCLQFQVELHTAAADYLSWMAADSDKNNKQKKDLSRRSSSGNWIEDRVTWKEELNYKKAMGYM